MVLVVYGFVCVIFVEGVLYFVVYCVKVWYEIEDEVGDYGDVE